MKFVCLLLGLTAADPHLNLLDKASCGKVQQTIDENGIFNLTISVTGRKGFTYDCSTKYNPAVGHADADCTEWVPQQVLKDQEALDIVLKAFDSHEQLATCMQWELVFNASEANAEIWKPAGFNQNIMQWMLEGSSTKNMLFNPPNGSGGHETGRKVALWQHLDAMTHLSHHCVPKNTPDYWVIPKWLPFPKVPVAFPPTAHTIPQLRLSHALLASTGVIWSIDRSCVDDVQYKHAHITIYESCVGSIPGLPDPHCHLICNQTWSMGPGGIATRGVATLSHHIPSPGLALVEFDGADRNGWTGGGVYGDKGCGDKHGGYVV
jgi:hypothetical protein